METALLIIVTFMLVIVTGFYTSNLSRIEIFNKRYKVYESLLGLIKTHNNFNIGGVLILGINHLVKLKDETKIQRDEAYNIIYGNVYENYLYKIESSLFLFNNNIYEYLKGIENDSKPIKDYIYKRLILDSEEAEGKDECEEALRLFESKHKRETIIEKFLPYLEFEENIFKWVCKCICYYINKLFCFLC